MRFFFFPSLRTISPFKDHVSPRVKGEKRFMGTIGGHLSPKTRDGRPSKDNFKKQWVLFWLLNQNWKKIKILPHNYGHFNEDIKRVPFSFNKYL